MASARVWQPRPAARSSPSAALRAVKNSRPNLPKRAALSVLRRRAEFLAVAASGKKWVAPGLILQIGLPRMAESTALSGVRYGLTATRKIGNAVIRNRARRRLRALAVELLLQAAPDRDYVLIARNITATREFAALRLDLQTALKKLGVWREVH